ncbi:peptidyl-prolyl cis-trans isomerase [Candidatus Fermentibacteria bacterium]|nr:peptidyl-prolyl cis-trans isomerase [Candidatus Fermentibacteria bacterium]
MKRDALLSIVVTAVILASLLASCGRGVRGDTWLAIVGEDTLTVADAGHAWTELEDAQRRVFTSGENPVGDFVLGMARRVLVERELVRLGYLESEGVAIPALAWARTAMFMAMQDSLRAAEARAVTEEDIEFFRRHLGTTVWYTIIGEEGETAMEPAHLAVLGPGRGGALAGLAPGETAPDPLGEGILRLDSMAYTDSALVAETLADTQYVEEFATARFAEWRAGRTIDSLLRSAWEASPPVFHLPAFRAFASYARGEAELVPEDTVMVFGPQVWTAGQMRQEVAFEASQRPSNPADTTWLYAFARVLVNRSILSAEYGIVEPEAATELVRESGRVALRIAADSLYDDFVQDSILITEEMLDSAWTASPPEVPEKRSLLLALMQTQEEAEAFRESLLGGSADSAVSSMGFLGFLSGDGPDPHVTRPLMREEIPLGLGDSLFALDPSDRSTWFGPMPNPGTPGWTAFRLESVVPAHTAGGEEARLIVFPQVLEKLRTERTEAWLEALEESYGLRINEQILDDLPADPSLWIEL